MTKYGGGGGVNYPFTNFILYLYFNLKKSYIYINKRNLECKKC